MTSSRVNTRLCVSNAHFQKTQQWGIIFDGKTGFVKFRLDVCCEVLNIDKKTILWVAGNQKEGSSHRTKPLRKFLNSRKIGIEQRISWINEGVSYGDFVNLLEFTTTIGKANGKFLYDQYMKYGHDNFFRLLLADAIPLELLEKIPVPPVAETCSDKKTEKVCVDFDACRERLFMLIDSYAAKNKTIFKIDENTAIARINIMVAAKVFKFDPGIFWLRRQERDSVAKEAEKAGLSKDWLIYCKKHGVTVKEVFLILRHMAGNSNYRIDTEEIVHYIEKTGFKKYFVSFFDGVIAPEHVIGGKKKSTDTNACVEKIIKLPAATFVIERDLRELAIVRHLQKLWGGEREAPTLSGNIDLFAADKLIEVKSGENWKHGIGQLIAYGYHKPAHQLVLYLFDYEAIDLANVRAVCGKAGIKVMLHR